MVWWEEAVVPAFSAVASNGVVFEGLDWALRSLDCWESAETVNFADAEALVADKSACTWSGVFDDRTRGCPSMRSEVPADTLAVAKRKNHYKVLGNDPTLSPDMQ